MNDEEKTVSEGFYMAVVLGSVFGTLFVANVINIVVKEVGAWFTMIG